MVCGGEGRDVILGLESLTYLALRHENEIVFLLLDLAVIVVAARLFGAAARRIGQPAVIGEIVAGIALGPTLLGQINPDWPTKLFPEYVPLQTLADIGLIFFMFLVGMELDTRLIRREAHRAVAISLTGIAIPLVLGVLVGLAIYSVNSGGTFIAGVDGPPDRAAFALFIGAAMCITAFPVLARILVETGLHKSAVGAITLCAAAIDDAIAWILLAAVVGIVEHGSASSAAGAFAMTLVFAAGMVVVVRPLLERFLASKEGEGLGLDGMALIFAGLCLSALATEQIGIHPVFGAFIFGAIVPKDTAVVHEFTEKIRDFTMVILLPVFFVITGLRTDFFLLDSLALLGWTLLILAAAIVGKYAGCSAAAWLTGSTRREASIIGALMNTRGLTELIILTVGYELGVLSDRTFSMMVIMAIVTTVMTAPLLRVLMSKEPEPSYRAAGSGARTAPAPEAVELSSNPR